MSDLFTKRDIEQIRTRGITLEQAESQVETFRKGFSYSHLQRPCTKGDGITVLEKSDLKGTSNNRFLISIGSLSMN